MNPHWLVVIPIVGFICVLVFFARLFRHRDQLLPEEKGLSPIHREIVGGRFDEINFTMPLVRVFLYNDFMVIAAWKSYLLEYSFIERVEVQRHIFSNGLHVYHQKYGIPTVIIWSRNCSNLKILIEQRIALKV